jgi:hypothetical protein
MNKIGVIEIQCVSNFLGAKKLVLRSDRVEKDNPIMELFDDHANQQVICFITQDIRIENMRTSPFQGKKERTDIYISNTSLDDLKQVFDKEIISLENDNIKFDITAKTSPNPTGLEHSNGLALGKIENITNINTTMEAIYFDEGLKVTSAQNTKTYVEAEHCPKGKRLHFGIAKMNSLLTGSLGNENMFIIKIPYSQLKKLSIAIGVAIKLLK